MALRSGFGASGNSSRRVTPDLRMRERLFVKIPAILENGQVSS
jgi:hypothetical protein